MRTRATYFAGLSPTVRVKASAKLERDAPMSPASAGTDPLVPYGTDPHSPYVFGYHVSDHDEANTTNGQVDVPF